MANHPSALKRHRQSLKRRQRNRDAKSTIRTAIKKITQLLESGDKEAAKTHARLATKLFDKAAVHGVLHTPYQFQSVNDAASQFSRPNPTVISSVYNSAMTILPSLSIPTNIVYFVSGDPRTYTAPMSQSTKNFVNTVLQHGIRVGKSVFASSDLMSEKT